MYRRALRGRTNISQNKIRHTSFKGSLVSDRYFTDSSKQQGWSTVVANGAISTVAGYAASKASNGLLGENTTGRYESLDYSRALMENMTSMACKSLLSAGLNRASGGALELESAPNWTEATNVDTLGMVAKEGMAVMGDRFAKYQKEQAANKGKNDNSTNDPLEKIENLLFGAYEGLKGGLKSLSTGAMNLAMGAVGAVAGIAAGAVSSIGGIFGAGAQNRQQQEMAQKAAERDSANKAFKIQDLNSAKNKAETGGYYKEDIQSSMGDLLTKVNNEMGLTGKQRITKSAELEALVQSGAIDRAFVEDVAMGGLDAKQMAAFNTSYDVAQGQRAGTIVAGNGGYVNASTGETVAGMWHNGVAESKPPQDWFDAAKSEGFIKERTIETWGDHQEGKAQETIARLVKQGDGIEAGDMGLRLYMGMVAGSGLFSIGRSIFGGILGSAGKSAFAEYGAMGVAGGGANYITNGIVNLENGDSFNKNWESAAISGAGTAIVTTATGKMPGFSGYGFTGSTTFFSDVAQASWNESTLPWEMNKEQMGATFGHAMVGTLFNTPVTQMAGRVNMPVWQSTFAATSFTVPATMMNDALWEQYKYKRKQSERK